MRAKYELTAAQLKRSLELVSAAELLTNHQHRRSGGASPPASRVTDAVNAALGLDLNPDNPNACRDKYKAAPRSPPLPIRVAALEMKPRHA